MIWVNCNESPLWPGDLTLLGDTIRTVITSDGPRRRTLLACGAPNDGGAQISGWPYSIEGCCWRLSCSGGART